MTTTFDSGNLSGVTLSGGNLVATCSVAGGQVRGADGLSSGKYYFECTATTITSSDSFMSMGVCAGRPSLGGSTSNLGASTNAAVIVRGGAASGIGINSSLGYTTWSTNWAAGGVICCAVDLTAGLIWFRIGAAGNWNNSATANPATGVGGQPFCGQVANPLPQPGIGYEYYPIVGMGVVGSVWTANFGGSAFSGTVPSGFTSGWTSGSGVGTSSAVVSQIGVDVWAGGSPAAQITQLGVDVWATGMPAMLVTQIGLEVWGSPSSASTQMLLTQIGLEVWGSVALAAAGVRQPMVCIIT